MLSHLAAFSIGLMVRFLYEQAHRTGDMDRERLEQSHTYQRRRPQSIQNYERNTEGPVERPAVGQEVPELVSTIEATHLTPEKILKLTKLIREKIQLNKESTATDRSEHDIGVPETDESVITYEGILAGFSEEEKVLMERSGTAAQRRRGR